jgi:hypothetical protein
MHRDGPLGMLPALRTGAFGIILALLGASDPTDDGAACSAGEMNHGPCSDY